MTELKNWSKSLLAEYEFWKKNVHNGHCPLPEWLIALFLNLSCGDEARHPNQIFNKDVLLRDAVIIARLFFMHLVFDTLHVVLMSLKTLYMVAFILKFL